MPSPLYAACIEWLPALKAGKVRLARPFTIGALPTAVEPSENCTVPVEAAGATAAVNVTGCPNTVVPDRELSVMVVGACTVCESAAEVAWFRLLSARLTAVMVCTPGVREARPSENTPVGAEPLPSRVCPSMIWITTPSDAGVMVAVNVTGAGFTTGFALEASVTTGVALFTTCTTAGEVLAPYPAFALYTAVSVWLPTASCVVVRWALPALSAALPNCVAPS